MRGPKKLDAAQVKVMTRALREYLVRMTTQAGSGQPSSSMSAVEVIAALYFFFGGIMKYNRANPTWADRDRFILSKGLAVPVLLKRS